MCVRTHTDLALILLPTGCGMDMMSLQTKFEFIILGNIVGKMALAEDLELLNMLFHSGIRQ